MKKILLAFALVAGISAVSYAQSSSSATAEPAKVEVAGQTTNEASSTDKAAAPAKSSTTKSCCSHKKGSEASCGGSKKAKAQNDAIKEEEQPNN